MLRESETDLLPLPRPLPLHVTENVTIALKEVETDKLSLLEGEIESVGLVLGESEPEALSLLRVIVAGDVVLRLLEVETNKLSLSEGTTELCERDPELLPLLLIEGVAETV